MRHGLPVDDEDVARWIFLTFHTGLLVLRRRLSKDDRSGQE